jgi:hypothetical protein
MATKSRRIVHPNAQHPNYPKPKTEIPGQTNQNIERLSIHLNGRVAVTHKEEETQNSQKPPTLAVACNVANRDHMNFLNRKSLIFGKKFLA